VDVDCGNPTCQNVLMYFTLDRMREAINHIARALASGGFLFLGHAVHAAQHGGGLKGGVNRLENQTRVTEYSCG
jgi:chemotaxis methyl-accepting protein methylase